MAATLWVGYKRLDLCSRVGNHWSQRWWSWSSFQAKGQEGETTLTVIDDFFLVEKGRKKTTPKIQIFESSIFCCSRILASSYVNPSRFQYEHSSTLASVIINLYLPNRFQNITFPNSSPTLHLPVTPASTHTPNPAWQVPLDDKFQDLRLPNRLTTKDPSRFWPGWRMQRQYGGGDVDVKCVRGELNFIEFLHCWTKCPMKKIDCRYFTQNPHSFNTKKNL